MSRLGNVNCQFFISLRRIDETLLHFRISFSVFPLVRRNGKKAQIRPNKREKRAKQQSLFRRRHDRSIEIIFVCDVKEVKLH